MLDITRNTVTVPDANADVVRWEDEKARPMWSSSGSATVSSETRRELDRKRPLSHDGNTLLM